MMSGGKCLLFTVVALCVGMTLCCGGFRPISDPWYVFVCPSAEQLVPLRVDSVITTSAQLDCGDNCELSVTAYRQFGAQDRNARFIALFLKLRTTAGAPKSEFTLSEISVSTVLGALPVIENSVHGNWEADGTEYFAELGWHYPDSCSCYYNETLIDSNCQIVVDFGQFMRSNGKSVALPQVIALDADSAWVALCARLDQRE